MLRVATILIGDSTGDVCRHRQKAEGKGEFCFFTGNACPDIGNVENCHLPNWNEAIEKAAEWDFVHYEKNKGLDDDLIAKRWRHAKERNFGMYKDRIEAAERFMQGIFDFEHIPEPQEEKREG